MKTKFNTMYSSDMRSAMAWASELKRFAQPSPLFQSMQPLLVDQYGRWLPRVGTKQHRVITFKRYSREEEDK